MPRTIQNLDDDVAGILQGTNLDNVTNKDGAYERAMRIMSQRAYIPEGSGRQSIMLYDGVTNYPGPASIFGGQLNDIRPQGVTRLPSDYVYKLPIEMFDRTEGRLPNGYQVTFETDPIGNPIMRIAQHKAVARTLIDPMNSVTGWVAGGTATALALDSTVFYQSPAALRFNVTSGAGYIEKTLANPIDLTALQGVGVGFLAIYCPDVTKLTSIELRIGSDSANYYTITQTQGFLGMWQSGEYLLVAFDLAQATKVLTPVITSMKYLRFTSNVTGTITNMRMGGFFISLPSPHEILFKSAAIFLSNGQLSSTIQTPNDTIILGDAAYLIFQHECAMAIALQNGGTYANGTISTINTILFGTRTRTGQVVELGLYDQYRADNPNEQLKSTANWYDD